ncbi:unnamed protein product [Acanthocheilonema viteae]|uniref:Neurotransmitter-gated ion-channel ligand-binding domain-containing protein n=1 Tax=Acanthocheilonema viteae TaxID=6277 RepID=A0A498SFT8_ACAVI|nr:unnamed protein product [Acanthocheilonema viteae]
MRLPEYPLIVWLTKLCIFTQVIRSETSIGSDTCIDLDPKCVDWANRGNVKVILFDGIVVHIQDEEKQIVRAYGRMVLSWNDTKVAWDRNQWELSWLNFYWIQIWTPQLIQINPTSINPGTKVNKVLAANYTGQVYTWLDFSFVAPYNFRYEDYPNDYQQVCFKFDDKQYFSVRFIIADKVKSKKREELTETYATGGLLKMLKSPIANIQMLGNWRDDPFDVQSLNSELCLGLRRNAVYFTTEMLLPALITSIITISVLFQLSTVQPVLIALYILAQIIALTLINSRLPTFAIHTPTIHLNTRTCKNFKHFEFA